jgi:hypothetical protein
LLSLPCNNFLLCELVTDSVLKLGHPSSILDGQFNATLENGCNDLGVENGYYLCTPHQTLERQIILEEV